MAQELSQGELLDFLCQAGGRVANAALLGHFQRFLRDPQAEPGQLQRRRQLFKGFVNSVATVQQVGPGAATYVVLRKRYRDLVGEEPRPAPAPRTLPEPQLRQDRWGRAGKSPGAASPRENPAPRREAGGGGRCSNGKRAAGRGAGRCPPGSPGLETRPPPPASPVLGCLGREKKSRRTPLAEPPVPQGKTQQANGLGLPVGEMCALPSVGSVQERIRDWIVTHHSASLEEEEEEEEEAPRVRAWSESSKLSAYRPGGSLDFASRSEGWREPPLPVFRSIRCRLSLQDLEQHLEQPSSASEEGGSSSGASRESTSRQGEGEMGRANGGSRNSAGGEGPVSTLRSNDPEAMPFSQAGQDLPKAGESLPHVALLHQMVGRAATLGQVEGRDRLKPRKIGRPPSPTLDAPLNPWSVPRQRPVANAPSVERLGPNPDGPAEHRSSLVPLDSREHTWLVKIAAGCWMQVQALLQEEPHLVLHRDFISGFTVLHWLAKHGNAQVLQDFVAGAQEAGIVLDVDIRSGCGYTPLHLAAIHSHPLIMKILVQKLQCRTQIRDSSGKKPWQYLSANASGEIWQLLGGPRGRTIFPTHPIVRPATVSSSSSASLAKKVSRKSSLASYLKPQHMKWKKGYRCPVLPEIEEYSD